MTDKILDPQTRDAAIARQIEEIVALRIEGLRERWKLIFGKTPPKGLTGDLLARMLTWKLQEDAYGGHSREVLKILDAAAKGKASTLGRRLKPGTQIIREYQGVRHTVTVMAEGFQWEGRGYPSLTAIARLITGSNWNGPRFFGLREKKEPDRQRTKSASSAEAVSA